MPPRQPTNGRRSSSFWNCRIPISRATSSVEMCPKIRATPHSAAASCNRIDFVASRLAAAAWLGWLACAVGITLFAELAWILRLPIALLVAAAGGRAVWRYVLLRGPGAVRALEWRESRVAPIQFY